jgi:hypothetical protein
MLFHNPPYMACRQLPIPRIRAASTSFSSLPCQAWHGYGVTNAHHVEVEVGADAHASALPSGAAAAAPPAGAAGRNWTGGVVLASICWRLLDRKVIRTLGEKNCCEPPSKLAPCASREKEAKTILCLSLIASRCLGMVTMGGRPLEAHAATAAACKAMFVRSIATVVCGTAFLATISLSSGEALGHGRRGGRAG